MTAEIESEESTCIIATLKRSITALIQVEVEPVGRWFHLYESSRSYWHLDDNESVHESDDSDDDQSEVPDVEIEDDIKFLRCLDPADWKNQDHYAVLGLKEFRYKATDDDIKKAYRVMVLRHHPDKRKNAGEEIREDDDYYTCITKAYEILGVPTKRMSYDSVDSEFDDYIPPNNAKSKANFYKTFNEVFERNIRWSTARKHTPMLGKTDDTRTKVEHFYNFWYDFDSWREFSYLDEEDKEKGQDREERRWIERQNKLERARRKREETARIRKMVDNAYNCDPRIAKFKEADKEKKMAVKKAKQDLIRQREIDEERKLNAIVEEERKKKEAEEVQVKAKQDAEKKERENVKRAFKKEKKTLRTLCREHNYYTVDEKEKVQLMTDIEYICEILELTKIQELNLNLTSASDIEKGKVIIQKQISEVKKHIVQEREKTSTVSSKSHGSQNGVMTKSWHADDLQLLIKAVNLFPAGTTKRWETVAEYINQHSKVNNNHQAKETLQKAKELQGSDQQCMKEAAKKNAFQSIEKIMANARGGTIEDSTQRYDTPQEMLGVNLTPWGVDEQRLLEQALKTFPSSTPERWDRIAECVPNRSKKECMKRYKELAEMVKAKKAATAAVNAKK